MFGRLERTTGPRPMSDINMTPLIDVMLVLLVIFMITAPLMTSSLKLDLPKTEAGAPAEEPASITLAIDAEGRYYFGEQQVPREALPQRLRDAARRRPPPDVLLRADRRVPYGEVAELIAQLQQAGLTRIGFIVEPKPPQ